MTEAEARAWLGEHVPRETIDRLEQLVDLIRAEAPRQNLIAASTLDTIWTRHIVDSAQLVMLVPAAGRWLDLGSGAGLPGLVVAILGGHDVTLVESRTKRITFLRDAVSRLGLSPGARVEGARVETLAADRFAVISARAFAPLPRLFETAVHLSGANTVWILPKGRSAQAELDAARGSWQGDFRIEPSVTDPEAAIIVASHVRPRRGGRNAGGTQ